jgi:hypothetical protein
MPTLLIYAVVYQIFKSSTAYRFRKKNVIFFIVNYKIKQTEDDLKMFREKKVNGIMARANARWAAEG